MKFYPAYLDLRDRPCLVVGGGPVAERKALSLLDAGAAVTIISPSLTPGLQALSDSGKITHHKKEFDEPDLAAESIVIAATSSKEVNSRIARLCKKRNMLVNVAVPPEEGNFIVPSAVERGELLIAISTGGVSPALAKKIRQELETRYGQEYGIFLRMVAAVRKRVLSEVADEQRRREIFEAIAGSEVIELLRQGKRREAEARLNQIADLRRT
jgi:precorrin-2 dehydrogenase/sirohydrochlorin ferrochelatase